MLDIGAGTMDVMLFKVCGAPWGDNMMTGNVGMLAAILKKKGT